MVEGEQPPAKKDMGEDFNSKVAKLLDQIEELKTFAEYQNNILLLEKKIHSLFVKLSGKMTKKEKEYQKDKAKKCRGIKPFKTIVTYTDFGDKIVHPKKNQDLWDELREILEDREIHLNEVLERLNMTNVQKKEEMFGYENGRRNAVY